MTINIYKPTSTALVQKNDVIEENCWVRIFEPTEAELYNVSKEQDIPIDYLNDPLDPNEGSRVEKDNDISFVLIRSPIQEDIDDGFFYETLPVGIILKKNIIITICYKPIPMLTRYLKFGNTNIDLNNKKSILLYLLFNSAQLILRYLKDIEKKYLYFEKKLNARIINQDLIDLHNLKKSLVYFTATIKGNISVVDKLRRNQFIKFEDSEIEFLDDILTEMTQALAISETQTNNIVNTLHSFASMISSNFANVMRILTGVTFFLLIPILITSIYGMNIKYLPFKGNAHNILWLSMITVSIILFFIYLFNKKKWM